MTPDASQMLRTFLHRLLLVAGMLAGIALTWGAACVGLTIAAGRPPRGSGLTAARLRVKAASDATVQYRMDNSSACPRGLDELVSLKYLDPRNTKDPWGKDLVLHCPDSCDDDCGNISSAGPDGREGTPDDINSWEL